MPLQADQKKKGAVGKFFGRLFTPSAVLLLAGWLLLFGLLWYVQHYATELAPFDPFDILKVVLTPITLGDASCASWLRGTPLCAAGKGGNRARRQKGI